MPHRWPNWKTPTSTYAPATMTEVPVASPSRPSVRFTPFDVAAIMKKAHRTNNGGVR